MQRPRLIAVLPTMLTLANGACGFGAITFAAKLGPTEQLATDTVTPSLIAASLIFLAMLFDMLDGAVARLMNQTSQLGAELDSLCDAVSFGVAPAFLMLQFVAKELTGGIEYHPRLLWTIAVLYALCAILRLARFNVDSDEADEDDSHDEFRGLPSPAAAGAIVAFPFAMPKLLELANVGEATISQEIAVWLIPAVRSVLPLLTLGMALLMVSNIRYQHFFAQFFSGQRTRRHVVQLVFSLAVIFSVHELAVPVIFCYFAFASPLRALWTRTLRGVITAW